MQEKDIAEKEFVSHNDVFADIVNGFLFHGRQVADPDDPGPASCRGYYIDSGKLHETVRDVARTVEKSGLVVSLVGIENQSASYRSMPIRVGCYDFSSYRSQLGRKEPQRVYPVVTLVLCYGMTRWPYPTRLSELLDVPEEWRPFVEDWRMALCARSPSWSRSRWDGSAATSATSPTSSCRGAGAGNTSRAGTARSGTWRTR